MATDIKELSIFKDEYILKEEVHGARISSDGTMIASNENFDSDEYMTRFAKYEQMVSVLTKVAENPDADMNFSSDGTLSMTDNSKPAFNANGDVPKHKVKCPNCGKEVDELLPNGYCSSSCLSKAKFAKAQSKIGQSGERTLELIQKVQKTLDILDFALNMVTELPKLIQDRLKLPEMYREYITLRIDIIFLQIKKSINLIMIKKNDLLVKILSKMKLGSLDKYLTPLIAQLNTIIQLCQQLQLALNTAMQAILAVLKSPMMGIPPQSYGFFMTAKSMQGEHAGKICIEIVPKVNEFLPIKNMLNIINYEAIEGIVRAALPPIQPPEYLLEPEIFKVRYALSAENVPAAKKIQQTLEALVVFGADSFPRYKRLSLTNIWFVLSILTGWGPTSRTVFGDFIFHGPM